MTASVWRVGQVLNSVQSSFVGLLRVWSIPIVLLLSLASGYTTYYGMSFFITWWIALIITVAVQSIIVICTLELAATHWRANLPRYLAIASSLAVALTVSVSFSYFKFYEFSQRDGLLLERQTRLEKEIGAYLDSVAGLKTDLVANQKAKAEAAAKEANQAYVGAHPAMEGEFRHKVGRGPFWHHYHELEQQEKDNLAKLETELTGIDPLLQGLRAAERHFSFDPADAGAYKQLAAAFQQLQGAAMDLASSQGFPAPKSPVLIPYSEFTRGMTPSFDMWRNISWFALACAAMVDFFTLILSYRLESTAPGPLTEEEQELAYQGLRQFCEFTINHNDELEFRIEKTELERARRVSDWSRMFTVAFLLNRGYLRKIGGKTVEFAPNLYPIIAERLKIRAVDPEIKPRPAGTEALKAQMERKLYG